MSSIVVAGDTSGSVTLQAPAVSGSTVLTLPAVSGTVITNTAGVVTQAMLSTNVAGNGPAFSAYLSVAITNIASATGVTVPYDTKLFDTASRYNNTASTVGGIPAYSFMPNVAGYYQVSGSCNYEASNGTTRVLFNTAGVSSNRLQDVSVSGTVISGTVSGSTLVYFNGTIDYISMSTYQAGTGQQRIQGGAGAVTWFTAFLARSA